MKTTARNSVQTPIPNPTPEFEPGKVNLGLVRHEYQDHVALKAPAEVRIDLPGRKTSNGVGRKGVKGPRAVGDKMPSKADAKYDYVVVGAGAAGAVTAARLAENGYKVLVLEGGQDKAVQESAIPIAHGLSSDHPDLLVDGEGYFVDHFSTPEANQRDDKYVAEKGGIFYPRGEGVGGSTRMNAMIFVRPDDVDWNNIAEITGDDSWNAANMQKYMNQLENNQYRPLLRLLHRIGQFTRIGALQNMGGHGFDGWLETTRADPKILLQDKQLLKMVLKTAAFSFKNLGGFGDKIKRLITLFDPNDTLNQANEGLTLTPTSITKDGRRNGPRDRLLAVQAKHPDNLTLRSGCKVDKVLLDDNNEAVGVQFRDEKGQLQTEATGREVLVAGGAFESPAILLRSGIGAEDQLDSLAKHGVEKKVIASGVGESLSDRYEYGLVFRLKKPLDLLQNLPLTFDENDPVFERWEEKGKGPYTTNGAVIAFQAKSEPSMDDPDLYFFLVPGKFEGYYPGYAADATEDPNLATLVILHENKLDKKGTVRVNEQDPSGQPKINFKYHEEEGGTIDDRIPLARGIQMGRKLIERFGNMVDSEVLPGAQYQSLEDIAGKVGTGSWGHHANGSVKMGASDDPNAVLDSKLNVKGTTGLRVIDASTFPDNVGSFIVSAVMMQAEKTANEVMETARAQDMAQGMPLHVLRAQ